MRTAAVGVPTLSGIHIVRLRGGAAARRRGEVRHASALQVSPAIMQISTHRHADGSYRDCLHIEEVRQS